MKPDEIKREREQLERDIEERQRQIDKANTLAWCEERSGAGAEDCAHLYTGTVDRTPRSPEPIVTRSAPAPQPQPSHGGNAGFTAREVALIEAVMSAVGEVLIKDREKAREIRREIEDQLTYRFGRKLDKMMSTLRGEILTERLAHERELRAQDRRYSRGAPSSQPIRESVHEMIELN